jgi:hypothetical protein
MLACLAAFGDQFVRQRGSRIQKASGTLLRAQCVSTLIL